MIISTRESEAVREKLLTLGISQISGASRTSVGGYTEDERPHDSEQFDVSDQRTLDEVVRWLMELEHIPVVLHCLLPRGQNGRPLHEPVQIRADTQLLPPQRADDACGIPCRLRSPRDKKARLRPYRKGA